MEKEYSEKSLEILFDFCGDLKAQFLDDIKQMKIPFEFVLCHTSLPNGFGYDEENDRYVAYTKRERSNAKDLVFNTTKKEEFRFFILKTIANDFGFYYELNNRNSLEKQWKYTLNTKERRLNESIGDYVFEGVYDHRQPAFEKSLNCLFRVYEKDDLKPQVEIYKTLLNSDKNIYCIEYDFDYKTEKFVQAKIYQTKNYDILK